MKNKDQQLLEEAYTAISESNLRSSLGHIAFVTKYENIIKELHNKKISYSEAMAKQSNLLMEIIKWMKSSSQKPIESVEEAYKSVNEEEGSFFKDKPEAPATDYKQIAAKDLEKFAFTLNNIGARLSTAYRELHKQTTPIASQDTMDMLARHGEELVVMSSEIEDIVGKLTRSEQ